MNYSNVDKRIWADKYVYQHHAYDKNNAGYVMWGPFYNRSSAIVS